MSRTGFACFVAASLALTLGGCGGHLFGGNRSSQLGKTSITFTWPQRSRLIPIAANSIKLTLTSTAGSQSRIVSRTEAVNSQTSTIEFTGLLPGSYTVSAEAFPTIDATGTAQARGSTTLQILAEQRSTFSVTMLSQVDRISISGPSGLKVGQRAEASAIAYNASNQIVLVDPSTVSWSLASGSAELSESTGATVMVKAINGSNFTLRATYTEPDSDRPTGTYSVLTEDGIYDPGTAYDTARTGNIELADVTGDSTEDRMFFLTTENNYLSVAPRLQPGGEAALFTHGTPGDALPLAASVASNGESFIAFKRASGVELYRRPRAGSASFAFALPADTLDIAATNGGTVYALVGTTTKSVWRYDAAGAPTALGGSVPASAKRIAADRDGNVYVLGNSNIWHWRPDGSSHEFLTYTGNGYDISAALGNLYFLHSEGGPHLSTVDVHTNTKILLQSIPTAAFFEADDLSLRCTVDPVTLDVYLGRTYEDFTFIKQAQVLTLKLI